jgi:hypothetical protein
VNTALTVLTPGGYGYERVLRRHRARLMAEARAETPASSQWTDAGAEGIRRREYGTYDDYLAHQARKFDEIIRLYGGIGRGSLLVWRLHFRNVFRRLRSRLPPDARILCAGARQGTEVEVLRELGFRNAWGIDLNPGPENPFVVKGDFLHLDAADGTLDLVYSNALDHAVDLRQFFTEHARALRAGRYALYDVALVGPSTFEAVQWDSPEQVLAMARDAGLDVVESRDSRNWRTVLLRKRDPEPA